MMPNIDFRLEKLFLRNFRCFTECTIDLHPQLTVLVAENGRGKSAILNAIGIAFGLFVDILSDTKNNGYFNSMDVREVLVVREVDSELVSDMEPVFPTEIQAQGRIGGQLINWNRTIKEITSSHRPTSSGVKELRQAAQKLREQVEDYSSVELGRPLLLPLISFYGTDRHWVTTSQKDKMKASAGTHLGRVSGYYGCLSASSSVTEVTKWYEDTVKKIRDPKFKDVLSTNIALLTAVREAAKVVIEPTGWSYLDWDFSMDLLVVEHQDKRRLPLSSLSDGIRNMVALVADIARRCACLNPHLGEDAARKTPGILLLDEIDMHLHPGWQQQVVDLLQKAFPAMQMIVSTHSPHVLSTVDMKSIRIIRFDNGDGWLDPPQFQTRGIESADVLARIMFVDPIPHVEEAKWLNDYHALIQQHLLDTPEAELLRNKIEAHFGIQHPVMLECNRMIRIERFKKSLTPTSIHPRE